MVQRSWYRFDAADHQVQTAPPTPLTTRRALAIGAKTVAGIGLGVLVVVVGVATAGIALEAVVVPSLLTKLAGGVVGGTLGLARGLGDEGRASREERRR